jgi:hypothetical protein
LSAISEPWALATYNFSMARRSFLLLLATVALFGGALSCRKPTSEVRAQLVSGTPAEQARAAVRLAGRQDVESVPDLIRLLDDQDPAVRMYAIMALQDLTGQTYGYKFYASEQERAAAVQRWREALRAGEIPAVVRQEGV